MQTHLTQPHVRMLQCVTCRRVTTLGPSQNKWKGLDQRAECNARITDPKILELVEKAQTFILPVQHGTRTK